MTERDPSTTDAATQLWSRFSGSGEDLEHVLAAADRVLTEIDGGLRRWIGAEGYGVLLKRAVSLTAPSHPALHQVADLAIPALASNGVVYRASDVAAGMIALLASLMDLLGRIIGAEMAARLVQHIGEPSPRGVVSKSETDTRND